MNIGFWDLVALFMLVSLSRFIMYIKLCFRRITFDKIFTTALKKVSSLYTRHTSLSSSAAAGNYQSSIDSNFKVTKVLLVGLHFWARWDTLGHNQISLSYISIFWGNLIRPVKTDFMFYISWRIRFSPKSGKICTNFYFAVFLADF